MELPRLDILQSWTVKNLNMSDTATLTKVVLETGPDGRAAFREEALVLKETKPQLYLSTVLPGGGMQLRESPPGYQIDFHCTVNPSWTFVLRGALEIGLPDGTQRVFRAGENFYANDILPSGATFDPRVHGHCSRQVGDEPVVTIMVRS
jgi:hypothetical protein